jgi:CDP-diacylglycerol--serine O-phosphatidyltransferase
MKILSLMKVADIFTVGNLCCGIVSILLAIDGFFDLSALLLFLAVVFDVLDGKIAGLMHQKNHFGKQIDSMSGLCFCRLRHASACTLQYFRRSRFRRHTY